MKRIGRFSSIKDRIASAQYAALKVVNKELITLYWDIGRSITERQQSEGWGKSVVEHLAKDLQMSFPGMGGFSSRNIWYMRNFYLCYCENTKLQPMVAEISWTNNLLIMEKCKDDLGREFFIDILLYHRHMKCLVAIELKTGLHRDKMINLVPALKK